MRVSKRVNNIIKKSLSSDSIFTEAQKDQIKSSVKTKINSDVKPKTEEIQKIATSEFKVFVNETPTQPNIFKTQDKKSTGKVSKTQDKKSTGKVLKSQDKSSVDTEEKYDFSSSDDSHLDDKPFVKGAAEVAIDSTVKVVSAGLNFISSSLTSGYSLLYGKTTPALPAPQSTSLPNTTKFVDGKLDSGIDEIANSTVTLVHHSSLNGTIDTNSGSILVHSSLPNNGFNISNCLFMDGNGIYKGQESKIMSEFTNHLNTTDVQEIINGETQLICNKLIAYLDTYLQESS